MNYNGIEFGDKVVGEVVIPIEIKETDIESIIVGSLEGGSNYWLGLDNTGELWENRPQGVPLSIWATKLLLDGKEVKFYDMEEEEDDSDWTLTLEKLIKGLKLNAQRRPWASDLDNFDGSDCDCVVQYAMFDEVVYG